MSNDSFQTTRASVHLHVEVTSPAGLCVLLVALCVEDEEGGVCVEWRAALRVRPAADVSAFPFTS